MIDTNILKKEIEAQRLKLKIESSTGESKSHSRKLTLGKVVTSLWRAPEIFLGPYNSATSYDEISDIYSLGIIAYQLQYKAHFHADIGRCPVEEVTDHRQFIKTCDRFAFDFSESELKGISDGVVAEIKGSGKRVRQKLKDIFSKAGSELLDLIERMLQLPENRISVDDALNHSCFKEFAKPDAFSFPQFVNQDGKLTAEVRAAEMLCSLESKDDEELTEGWLRQCFREIVDIVNSKSSFATLPDEPPVIPAGSFREGLLKKATCFRDASKEDALQELEGQKPGTCIFYPGPISGIVECAFVGADGKIDDQPFLISNVVGDFTEAQEIALACHRLFHGQILATLTDAVSLDEHLKLFEILS